MMTDLVLGQRREAVATLLEEFSKLTRGEVADTKLLGEAQILAGVTKFPTRIKCATLAWHALDELLSVEK